MNLLGILYAASGRNSAALHAYTACMQAYRDAGDLRQLVKPLANVGPLLLRMGDITAAQDALMEGLELAKQIGDQRGESHFLNNLGIAAFQQGNYRAAAEYYQACADLCAQINHDSVRLVALYNLAEIALLTDRTAEAHTLAQQAALLAEQFGDRRNQALALRILGMACLATDPDRALAHLTHARELARATQSPPILLDVAYGWAHLYLDRGEHTAAHALLAMIANHPASEGYLLRQVEAYTSLRDLPPCSADAASTQLETFAQG
jgi:tetratricopeptide (TPR) repeat protein